MNSFLLLIKNDILKMFNSIKYRETKKGKKSKPMVALLGAIAIMGYLIFEFYMFSEMMMEAGLMDLFPVVGVGFSLLIIFTLSMYNSHGMLFAVKDLELLQAMPIKTSVILASKVTSFLLMNIVFSMVIMMTTSGIYFARVACSPVIFLITFITAIFIPIIPMVICAFISMILSFFTAKTRFKNAVTTVTNLIAIIAIMVVSFMFTSALTTGEMISSETIVDIYSSIPIFGWFCSGIISFDLLALALAILTSSLVFIAFSLVFSKMFVSINIKFNQSVAKSDYKHTELKTSSSLTALIKKELKIYFSTPLYVLNTAIGPVIMLLLTIYLPFTDTSELFLLEEFSELHVFIVAILIAFMLFMIGISCTTCSSISMEGQSLWILKSLPISFKEIVIAKFSVFAVVILPITLSVLTALSIIMRLSVLHTIILYVSAVIITAMVGLAGLAINLNFPKLNWTNPASVVKQSGAVLINMLFIFALVAALVVIYVLTLVDIFIYTLITVAILAIIAVAAYLYLMKKGKELFRKI